MDQMMIMMMPTSSNNTVPPCWKQQYQKNMEQRRQGLDAASISRADAIATECRNRLMDSMKKISSQSSVRPDTDGSSKLGLLLSGGVDSTAILQAAALSNVQLDAAITVFIIDPSDEENTTVRRSPEDELYAIEAARLYNDGLISNSSSTHKMEHSIVKLTPADLIKEYSRPTIKTLALWGYMETRNSLIISAALHEAAKLGLTDVIVGDNADELFGGSYDSYFHEKYINDHEAWKKKRNSMADLPFVTQKLATAYGITVHQPFTDQEIFVKWALNETSRNDCITTDKCELQSHFGGPYEVQNCGKLPLREAFCTVASWRRMDWIFRGSGASDGDILVDHYNTSIGISDDEFQSEQAQYLAKKSVKLKSKEHLHNIRIFQEVFGGLVHPTKERYPIGDPRGCVSCCFEIDEQFCHLCDEYPAQHPQRT
jgi:7-cyano-7-deazaguanine synthase in queuosine biosynthesis